jgi:hypothetical protein
LFFKRRSIICSTKQGQKFLTYQLCAGVKSDLVATAFGKFNVVEKGGSFIHTSTNTRIASWGNLDHTHICVDVENPLSKAIAYLIEPFSQKSEPA